MKYDNFTVVLPVYNEKGTIGKLIRYIEDNYSGAKVIVADDGSVDGSREIVRNMSKRNNRVLLIDRKKMHKEKGLTSSVIDGIMTARTEYVIVMDADMQHPPGIIKDIAEKLVSGFDIAVATRSDVTEWSFFRKIISKTLIFIAYIVLKARGSQSCSDVFSGYFGIRRRVFVDIFTKNKKRFVGSGYKVLFDLLKCIRNGKLKVAEVPYVFKTRKTGKSKAGIKQGLALIKSFFT